jgi:endonuclease III
MKSEKIKEIFNLISNIKIEYFVSDYCRETQEKPIKEHVERQITERLKDASDSQKNTNFIIALLYDQNSKDKKTQEIRIKFKGKDLLKELRKPIPNIPDLRYGSRGKTKLEKLTLFLKQNNIKYINTYFQQNNIATVKEAIDNIYGVGPKLRDWSITNVTGKEYVIDTHIARVLYRLSIVLEDEYKRYKNFSYYEDVRNKFKKISEGCFDGYGYYKGFAATQYLWFFGKHICKKNNPSCNECKINNCNYRNQS